MIRTKIVATLGPASSSVETLLRLFEEGTDICRLNFSHGELKDHEKVLKTVREAAAKFADPIAILGDLGGPKIRLGKIADADGSGGMPIAVGDTLTIQRKPVVGEKHRVSTNYARFVDEVRIGDRVLVEDGMLKFVVIDKNENEIVCTTTVGGVLKSAKGVNLPNTPVTIPSITDRDWQCVDWAIENELDFLAMSFVRKPDELLLLRQHLQNKLSTIDIIAKIEKSEAMQSIDAIIDASDGLMVARGDLGVEMDVAQVPIIQKQLVRKCQAAGKPVIVATQMLQSMIEQSSPTRAEVSDVANAIFDGTDAVMLSGETSVGKYPAAAVHVMSHVAEVTEQYLDQVGTTIQPQVLDKTLAFSAAVARGVWQIIADLRVKLVAVWSQTGMTARIFSKYRFPVPIVAFSSDPRTLRQMAIHYGVIPREMLQANDVASLISQVDQLVQQKRLAAAADRIVIVAGSALGAPGTMNGIIIHTVGESPLVAATMQV